jgi:hypothetical protein
MLDDVLDRLSFLHTSDASVQDKSYHFLHLTFQEFFAAQYFVRCWRLVTLYIYTYTILRRSSNTGQMKYQIEAMICSSLSSLVSVCNVA